MQSLTSFLLSGIDPGSGGGAGMCEGARGSPGPAEQIPAGRPLVFTVLGRAKQEVQDAASFAWG